MVLIWILTWFLYWSIVKNELSTINVVGIVASASFIALPRFSSARLATPKAPKLFTPQVGKNIHLNHTHSGSTGGKKTPNQQPTPSFQIPITQQNEKHPNQTTVAETQKQEPEPQNSANKPLQPHSNANGCPKNLEYYTKKPRPKETPEECFTCQNLITCVCLVSE